MSDSLSDRLRRGAGGAALLGALLVVGVSLHDREVASPAGAEQPERRVPVVRGATGEAAAPLVVRGALDVPALRFEAPLAGAPLPRYEVSEAEVRLTSTPEPDAVRLFRSSDIFGAPGQRSS